MKTGTQRREISIYNLAELGRRPEESFSQKALIISSLNSC